MTGTDTWNRVRSGPRTIGGRLFLGLLGLFAISGLGVTFALRAALDVQAALQHVATHAEEGRRLGEVAGHVRDFYIHQAHIALGLHAGEHLAETREARAAADAALDAYERRTSPARTTRVREIRDGLRSLDRLLDDVFLPAFDAGRHEEALKAHHESVDSVSAILEALAREQARIAAAIQGAEAFSGQRSTRALVQSVAALAGSFLLALGVAAWMGRGISVPVGQLRAAARALPEAPPGTRVPEGGPAEVRALGVALNQMLEALEAQRRASAAAETLAALGRVAAGIAHEVNNPLGVILGHARMIERAGGPAADDAAVIAREALACQAIVRDLLDYARPGALRRQPVDLADVARAAAERAGGASVAVEGAAPSVAGDRPRLEQLVYNLLLNGLAFGSRASVRVEPAADAEGRPGVRLTVRDDGPGVPLEDQERIFEPFFTTRSGGTGLGLAIARSVATAHDGTLRARADAGPGGCFELWLPAEAEGGAHPGG